MCKAVLSPSPNHSKMSVTNEEVNGGAQSIAGSSGTTPTTSLPRQNATPSSSLGSSMSSVLATNGPPSLSDDVVKSGYLRKLKGKKKFFVLRKETDGEKPARLEYYANEKKFRMGHPPKKSIVLKSCFNISGPDSNLKSKYSISLHTHNDCVRISMSNEEETNEWLRVMKSLSGEEEDDQTAEGKPHFEHIWLVHALNKGLGSKENILGPYRLCLTSKELTLLKVGEHDGRNGQVRFPLNVIRNVSHDATFGCFFHIELGRLACTGPGQLSLKTDDNNIAQNMHLLILKAMQNYSKDDIIPPRERARTYTWESIRPSHNTPPGMIGSMDESRIRTDSMDSEGRMFGKSHMSPPVPILSSPPSILFNSPNMYSTGTDSASSSLSIDCDNNNHSLGGSRHGDKSNDEEEYVPFNPMEDQHIISPSSMKLPLHPIDIADQIDTGKESTSSNDLTPSSYMEMQSPMSPFDNYLPMSPAGATGSIIATSSGASKCNGKMSANHSRNSSLIEDNDAYVPMIPGGGHNSRSESGAGSTTGLDDAYLNMDFTRKINLSNDDVRRASPASSESLQSNTPSSDFPLEKVQSYLTDDFDYSMRPMRAYSVGSKSDTATGKLRPKNRLEAVQETIRIRAMSVGSKVPRKPPIFSNSSMSGNSKPAGVGPLSSSWSGSTGTGRWPLPKFANNHHYPSTQSQNQQNAPTFSNAPNDSTDWMELDFSKNKTRKRSNPGPTPSLNSTASSTSSIIQKLSPAPKGVLVNGVSENLPNSGSSEVLKSFPSPMSAESNYANRNYVSSAPISIKKSAHLAEPGYTYHDTTNSQSIITRLTGTDLKKVKDLDDEGAYLNMDFTNNKSSRQSKINSANKTILSNDSTPSLLTPTKLCLNLSSTPITCEVPSSRLEGSNGETTCNNSKNLSQSDKSGSVCSDILVTSLTTSGLTRIEESPEKLEHSKGSSGSISPQSPASKSAPLAKPDEDDPQVTYASLDHLSTVYRPSNYGLGTTGSVSNTCGTVAASSNKVVGVTYAQIDFVKSAESIKPNS